MFRSNAVWLSLAVMMSVGCQSSMFPQKVHRMVGFRGEDGGRENPAEQTVDPWVQDAGTIARAEHQPEPIHDPLKIRDFFVSSKARDIERNLGVGD
ncbi:hypothetical protein AB1L42_03545 [Thalassoglobus sp. JC818]|uniref:hypothetical protein n=1 Tax=Thalassoglobus sp. JC818 TaxID=3232136 RepID=UPI003458137A